MDKNDNWTDAERLAAEVLASGSDEALRELLGELDRGRPPLRRAARPSDSSASGTWRRLLRRGRLLGFRADPSASRFASWRESGVLNFAVDAAVVVAAVASILIGSRPLLTPVSDARPVIAEAFQGFTLPAGPELEPVDAMSTITAADRPVTSGQPLSILARNLEATVGRYRSVAGMHADRKLPCAQLRSNYSEVEDAWIRYSVARGRSYGDRLPETLVRWDEVLYEAVQDVDRDFTASGCSRL